MVQRHSVTRTQWSMKTYTFCTHDSSELWEHTDINEHDSFNSCPSGTAVGSPSLIYSKNVIREPFFSEKYTYSSCLLSLDKQESMNLRNIGLWDGCITVKKIRVMVTLFSHEQQLPLKRLLFYQNVQLWHHQHDHGWKKNNKQYNEAIRAWTYEMDNPKAKIHNSDANSTMGQKFKCVVNNNKLWMQRTKADYTMRSDRAGKSMGVKTIPRHWCLCIRVEPQMTQAGTS